MIVIFVLAVDLTIKSVAFTFSAFELEQDMADLQLTEHMLDFFS